MLKTAVGIKNITDNPKSIFYLLTPDEKEELQRNATLSKHRRNEFIFKERDKPDGLLTLVEGKVKIFKEGVGGRELIIRMAKPPGIIGYRALLSGQNHIASALTLEESVICTIKTDFIMNRALKNSDFSFEIIRKLARELEFANDRMISLSQKHIRGRLAESLIILRNKYGVEKDGATLRVYLSREDISNLSNMTTSNAIRTLTNFASERIIAIDGRKIKILDADRLERVSKLG
ncbi:MAG TPA: Crp/Fnr family transcriptional regulator [Draconibacterium sp.]|nr:Crp/Fnr family transcriptional regulator [Draconibacterium sp.]